MSDSNKEHEMPFSEHLHELRKRLFLSIVAIAIGAGFSFCWSKEIFSILSDPYFKAFPSESLVGMGPAEAFILRLKMSALTGLIVTSPIIFSQIWLFISPGLRENEKKLALPFVVATSSLFLIGVSFCYFVVLPFTFEFFFAQYKSIGIEPTIRISEHLSLFGKAILGFGVVFQLPILAFFLGRLGIIDYKMLINYSRHAIVVIFLVGAVLTPPDILTQVLMAGPLLCLYALSIIIVKLTAKEKDEQ